MNHSIGGWSEAINTTHGARQSHKEGQGNSNGHGNDVEMSGRHSEQDVWEGCQNDKSVGNNDMSYRAKDKHLRPMAIEGKEIRTSILYSIVFIGYNAKTNFCHANNTLLNATVVCRWSIGRQNINVIHSFPLEYGDL